MRVLLLLLLALVQGTIVSLSTKEYITGPPYEVDWVDPSNGQFTKIDELNLGTATSGGVLRNDNTVVYPIQNNTFDAYLTTVELSTGKIQVGKTYSKTTFFDIQFDKVTDQTFALANSASFGVFEVLSNQTLRVMTKLPGGTYGLGGAYSSSKHIYFLTTGGSNLLAVSTVGPQEGTILYNVSTGFDQVGNLMYDDTFGVLYVWGYNSNRTTILASVDYTTGKTLKTFFTSPTTFYGPSCIDKAATTVYTFRSSNEPLRDSLCGFGQWQGFRSPHHPHCNDDELSLKLWRTKIYEQKGTVRT